mmetsp:Transcript_7201/g.23654  ORF Transcript_7201/g.23654 Transcript_7201/m.23654 type:complete len:332 (-) Transcript_7201:334-1329(-)
MVRAERAVGHLAEQVHRIDESRHTRGGAHGRRNVHVRGELVVEHEGRGAPAARAERRARDVEHPTRVRKGLLERHPPRKEGHVLRELAPVIQPAVRQQLPKLPPGGAVERAVGAHFAPELGLARQHGSQLRLGASAQKSRHHCAGGGAVNDAREHAELQQTPQHAEVVHAANSPAGQHQRGPPPVGDVRIKEGACPQRLCGSTGGERRQRAHALAQLTDKVLEQQLGAGPRLAVQGLLVDPAHVGLERVVQHTHHPGRVSRPPRGGQLVLQRLDVPPVVLIRPRLVSPGLPPLGAVQRLGALPPLGVRRVPPEHRPLPPHPKRAPFHEAEQ